MFIEMMTQNGSLWLISAPIKRVELLVPTHSTGYFYCSITVPEDKNTDMSPPVETNVFRVVFFTTLQTNKQTNKYLQSLHGVGPPVARQSVACVTTSSS